MGGKPKLCEHGVLGKSKCKQCLRKNFVKWYNQEGIEDKKIKRGTEVRRKHRKNNRQMYRDESRKLYHEDLKHYQEYARDYKNKKIEEIRKIIGKTCIVCGSPNVTDYHETHGKKHKTGASGIKYLREHLNDFVPLCRDCHKTIHRLAKLSKLQVEEILKLMALIEHVSSGATFISDVNQYEGKVTYNEQKTNQDSVNRRNTFFRAIRQLSKRPFLFGSAYL